jgi:hypothetical protein
MTTVDDLQRRVKMNNFNNNLNTDGIIIDVLRLM